MPTAPCPGPAIDLDPAVLQLPLSVLNLTARAVHCLSDVPTIAALLDCTEVSLVTRRNFGRMSLIDVRRKLVLFLVDRGSTAAERSMREAFYDSHPSFSALWQTPPQARLLRTVVADLLELLSHPEDLRRAEPWPYSTTGIGPPRAIDLIDVPLQEVVEAIFVSLKPRERRVLERRYGGLETDPATLAEVGREMGLTRERVRQIVQACMARLNTEVQRRRRIPFMARILECLEEAGGVIHERQLATELCRRSPPPHPDLLPTLRVLMALDPRFRPAGWQIWALEATPLSRVAAIQEAFHARLVAAARPIILTPFLDELSRESDGELSRAFLQACLDADGRIARIEGDLYGLVAWRHDGSPPPTVGRSGVRSSKFEVTAKAVSPHVALRTSHFELRNDWSP